MSAALPVAAGYAAIGGVSLATGASYAAYHPISPAAASLIQHAAAGAVLAGLMVDVLSKLLDRPDQWGWTALGLCVGVLAMLAIRSTAGRAATASTLVVTIVGDVLIDGVLIGLSVTLGAGTGLLLAIALAPEMLMLGATAAGDLRWDRWHVVAAVVLGFGVAAAGVLGWAIAQTTAVAQTVVLGFGASAFIYLVLEELLREAHEADTGPVEVAVLFAGFVPFFLAGVALA